MDIETTVRYHFKPTRMTVIKKTVLSSVGENMGKLDSSYSAGRNVKQCSHLSSLAVSQMLNSELPDDLAIAILGISPKRNENIHAHKYTGVLKIAKSRTSPHAH